MLLMKKIDLSCCSQKEMEFNKSIIEFMMNNKDKYEDKSYITRDEIYKAYLNYCLKNKYETQCTSSEFCKQMRKLFNVDFVRKRMNDKLIKIFIII